MTKLKAAMVGAGGISQFHLYAWQQIADVEVVAIADPDFSKAPNRANEFNIPKVYGSLDDALADGQDFDFIDIAALPEANLQIIQTAAANGIPILCQKPLAHTLQEAREMIAICDKAGVLFSINENWRWRSWYRRIRDIIRSNVLGEPIYVRFFCHSASRLLKRLEPSHRFARWKRAYFFDWGLHYVDILRFLFGEPQTVYARMFSMSPEVAGDDRSIVHFNYPCMAAILDFSATSYDPYGFPNRHEHVVEDLRIEGEHGTLRLIPDDKRGDILQITTASNTQTYPAYVGTPYDAYRSSYIAAQQHFVDCLHANKLPETHARDNIKSLGAMLAAYESSETNQIIDVAQFLTREDR